MDLGRGQLASSDQIFVGGILGQAALGLRVVKLGKLFMKLPHGGVARFRGHLTALRRAFQVERPIFFRIHLHVPYARQRGFALPLARPITRRAKLF